MVLFIMLVVYGAFTMNTWFTAQALLLFTTGQPIVPDAPYKRFWLGWGLMLVSMSFHIAIPWGLLADAIWWCVILMLLEVSAAQGLRAFAWLMVLSLVKRLTLIGLLTVVM
ncbi:hypothetical protein BH11PLA2_BH11PLA2_29780 [soil metagenome]